MSTTSTTSTCGAGPIPRSSPGWGTGCWCASRAAWAPATSTPPAAGRWPPPWTPCPRTPPPTASPSPWCASRRSSAGGWRQSARFSWQEDRDGWDYLYDVNRLADLGGKKLHAKRNHIHRFDEQFPDWLFEPITPANIPECLELERAWSARRQLDEPETGEETLSEETIAVIEALYQMESLALEGGLIRAGGRPVAFSLGSLTTPACFDVHFEKADGDIQGAYAVINREMARMVRDRHPQVKWLNREDDLGLEGLRKAKLSYYPDILLEKFTAREV